MPRVSVYFDDILITEESELEHLQNLAWVLQKLADAGVCLKREKCIFQAAEVIYQGYKINATGLHPVEDKVQDQYQGTTTKVSVQIEILSRPVNYYGNFLPNLPSILAPLRKLLQKGIKFQWDQKQKTFAEAK